jgi:hypothetical protein
MGYWSKVRAEINEMVNRQFETPEYQRRISIIPTCLNRYLKNTCRTKRRLRP